LSNGGVEEVWDVYFVIDRFLLDFSEPWATPFPPEARVSCDTVAGAKFRTPSTLFAYCPGHPDRAAIEERIGALGVASASSSRTTTPRARRPTRH